MTKASLQIEAEIAGSQGNTDMGVGLEVKLVKVEQPEEFLIRHKLPRESGTAVIVEFMLRNACNTDTAEAAAKDLLLFLKHHFEQELKRNVQFRGLFAFAAMSELDGARVIRLSLCYKRMVSVDAWLELMRIPYTLNDLVPDLNGEIKTSMALSEILSVVAYAMQMDSAMTAEASFSISCRKKVLLSLLKRLKLALEAGYTEHQVLSVV